MDFLGEHVEHDATEKHIDVDIDLSPSVIAKMVKVDLPLLLAVVCLLALFVFSRRSVFHHQHLFCLLAIAGLRPPLRAPPFFSA